MAAASSHRRCVAPPANHLPEKASPIIVAFGFLARRRAATDIKFEAKAAAEVIEMAASNPAAFRKALAYARETRCAQCGCSKQGQRYCEMLGRELPKQCCICYGGHRCPWWDLCEASQEAREADGEATH